MSETDKIMGVVLKHYPDVQAVYLFGSYGTDDQWPDSDVDIAVLLPHVKSKKAGSLVMSDLRFELESLLKMIPGVGQQLGNANVDERGLVRTEAIINSMTGEERRNPKILNGSRRKRIAGGSGTRVQDVNQLMNQFQQMKKMMKQMKGKSFKGMGNMPFGLA